MMITNMQFSAGERGLSSGKILMFFHIMVDKFSETHEANNYSLLQDQYFEGYLLTTVKMRHTLYSYSCTSVKYYLFKHFRTNTRLRQNVIYLAPNDPETADNIDVMNICHPVKQNIVCIFEQISILKMWMKNRTKMGIIYK